MVFERMDLFVFCQQYGTEVPGNDYDDPSLLSMRNIPFSLQYTMCVPVCSVHVHGMCVFFFFFFPNAYSTVYIYVLLPL